MINWLKNNLAAKVGGHRYLSGSIRNIVQTIVARVAGVIVDSPYDRLTRYIPIQFEDRTIRVEKEDRYIPIQFEDRTIRSRKVKTLDKDPGEVLEYTFDFAPQTNDTPGVSPYTDWLASGVTLSSFVVTVPAGITLDSSALAFSNTAVKAVLSGGTIGDDDYRIKCTGVGSDDQTIVRSLKIHMKER